MTEEYVLLKCNGCKTKKRITVQKDYEEGFNGRRRVVYYYNGQRVNSYGTELRYNKDNQSFSMDCTPECYMMPGYRMFFGQRIQGFKNEIPCSKKCLNAAGHVCECSCGGVNHGGKWAA
jgi:hypothetical protein